MKIAFAFVLLFLIATAVHAQVPILMSKSDLLKYKSVADLLVLPSGYKIEGYTLCLDKVNKQVMCSTEFLAQLTEYEAKIINQSKSGDKITLDHISVLKDGRHIKWAPKMLEIK